MTEESGGKILDLVEAQLVDCTPEPPEQAEKVPLPDAPADGPTERAREATIEQTGAGPPPERSAPASTPTSLDLQLSFLFGDA